MGLMQARRRSLICFKSYAGYFNIGFLFVSGTLLLLCGIKHKESGRELPPWDLNLNLSLRVPHILARGTFNFAPVP